MPERVFSKKLVLVIGWHKVRWYLNSCYLFVLYEFISMKMCN